MMRAAAVLMGFVFAVFAALQLNDPDTPIWAGTYGLVAALSFAAAARRGLFWLAGLVAAGTFLWGVALLPAAGHVTLPELFGSFPMKTANIEEAREGLGLLIAALWSGFLALAQWKRWAPFR
jgi:hypothetical protein